MGIKKTRKIKICIKSNIYLVYDLSISIQNVVAAIIKKNNLYFIAQRNKHKHLGLKWEFPGGKVHLNESFKEALLREIKEE